MSSHHKHVHELDGLRGIAVIIVIVSHSANEGFLPEFLGRGFGQQGVALFYLLSGYLIFHLYLDRDFTRQNFFQYAIARAARVLPLFYAVVVAAAALLALSGEAVYHFTTTSQLLANLLLIHGTSVLWSIPVEIQFYALFVLLWSMRESSFPMPLVLALVVAIQIALAVIMALKTDIPTTSLPYWLHFFVLGGVASLNRKNLNLPNWFGIVTLCVLPLALPEIRRMLGLPVLPSFMDPITAGYPILVFLLALWGARPFSFLASPVLGYLGQISFGAYLLHWPVIYFVSQLDITGIVAFSFVSGATFLLASISLRLYERPVQRFLRSSNSNVSHSPSP